jgi:hypothetical protein
VLVVQEMVSKQPLHQTEAVLYSAQSLPMVGAVADQIVRQEHLVMEPLVDQVVVVLEQEHLMGPAVQVTPRQLLHLKEIVELTVQVVPKLGAVVVVQLPADHQ